MKGILSGCSTILGPINHLQNKGLPWDIQLHRQFHKCCLQFLVLVAVRHDFRNAADLIFGLLHRLCAD